MLKYWLFLSAVSSTTIADVVDYHAHPRYGFEYGVNDPSTQDVKNHWETRDGDKVQGSYSFKEADGTVRVVEYHANDRTGFNAVVRREGHSVHPPTHHRETVVYTPTRTHAIVRTVPVESVVHNTVHTLTHIPHHTHSSSSVNIHRPKETVIYAPVHTAMHKPVHMVVHTSVNSQHPVQTSVHTPVSSVLHTSVRSPVHITPVYATTHTARTPVHTIVHHTKKTTTPIETAVQVPVNHPGVSVHHAVTKEIEERKEPEVYNSQIAGARTASLISAIPQYYI